MAILLTHASALRILRRADIHDRLESWGDLLSFVPEKLPQISELKAMIPENEILRSLPLPLQLLVSSDVNSHSSKLIKRHISAVSYPADAFLYLDEGIGISGPEMCLFQMAQSCSIFELALLISEFCSYYSIDARSPEGFTHREKPLTTLIDTENFLERMQGNYGVKKVRKALRLAVQDAYSPMESKLALRLLAPRKCGGYNVPIVSLNEKITLQSLSGDLDALKIRKPDILILDPRRSSSTDSLAFTGISLDYNGRIHLSDLQAAEDERRRNELLAHGIKPYTINKLQYDDINEMDALIVAILKDLKLPYSHLASGRNKRIALHDELERACLQW